jgi:hypothetical protein
MSTPDEMTAIFTYLDALHASGVVNMFKAGPYLQQDFNFDEAGARSVLVSWFKTFDPNISAASRADQLAAEATS